MGRQHRCALNTNMDRVHPAELKGQKVLLMGLGSFGGGVGCARTLIALGADLTITDLRSEEQLALSLKSLRELPWKGHFGGHSKQLFDHADVVVVNPAVPNDASYLQYARSQRCRLTTEINLALAQVSDLQAVVVTGTHGKSSTATLCADLLDALPGRTLLAGNMGGSLLEAVQDLTPEDRMVLELSSFQLERLIAPPAWPKAVILTCMRADHLDRHHTMEAYEGAKLRVLSGQNKDCTLYAPASEARLQTWRQAAKGKLRLMHERQLRPQPFGLDAQEMPMAEPYRAAATLAAIEVARDWGVPDSELGPRLKRFRGLPHRLQPVAGPTDGLLIDNAIATHPEPTAEALRSMDGTVLLLAGGKDKGLPLDQLVEAASSCAAMHLFGSGGRRLADELVPRVRERAQVHDKFVTAAQAALEHFETLPKPSKLLFSPSFSSYDEFQNFQQRADLFQNICTSFFEDAKREPVTPNQRRANSER
jgi:UDP-N-acetylmuramoylalanine--D-glutamate ligase